MLEMKIEILKSA